MFAHYLSPTVNALGPNHQGSWIPRPTGNYTGLPCFVVLVLLLCKMHYLSRALSSSIPPHVTDHHLPLSHPNFYFQKSKCFPSSFFAALFGVPSCPLFNLSTVESHPIQWRLEYLEQFTIRY